jgi:hypothetical protein
MLESNGAPDSSTITNPQSGAQGSMQVMPATAKAPGFGVPASDGTPQGNASTGRAYMAAMQSRYQNPLIAAMAYNWGPGNVDKWLANGADMSKVPTETLKYASNYATITGAGQAPVASAGADLGFTPMSQFNKTYGTPAKGGANQDANPIVALGAGLGRGVQQTALGAQALVGKGLQALGADQVGGALVNDAQQGNAAGEQEYAQAAGDSLSGKIGRVVGGAAPALVAGPEILPQALAGAEFGAGNAALNNEAIGPAAVEGAGFGAGGAALGQGLGAAYQSLKPLVTKAGSAVKGGEDAAAAVIAKQIGSGDLDQTISNLKNNSNEIIPNSLPTAAEAGGNPALIRFQRQMQNTPEGQAAFPARQAANNEARLQAGQNAVGPSLNNSELMGPGLEAEAQAFTKAQAQRVAQGMMELPPVSAEQAQLMQTPAYQRAITAARQDAQDAGIDSFQVQQQGIHNQLSDAIDQVAGTPQSLDAAIAARRAQAVEDYAPLKGQTVDATSAAFKDLEARPGFRTAYREAAGLGDNLEGANSADPFITRPGERSLQVSPNGEMNWVDGPAQRLADAALLQSARSNLAQMENAARAAGKADVALGFQRTREALDSFLNNPDLVGQNVADAFAKARANYAQNSIPINQQQFLQQRLAGAVNNLTGEVNPSTLNSTINTVARDQLKPGIRPGDSITPEQLQQLQALGQQARAANGNMTGLNGQGQELIRQQLETQASKSVNAQAALDAFNARLAKQSPTYAEMQNAANGYGQSLASRQSLADMLARWNQNGHNAFNDPQISLTNAKQAFNLDSLKGVQREYANNLLADLQRASSANVSLGAAGSQTAANLNLGGGLLGDLLSHKIGNATIGTALATGHIGTAVLGSIGQKLLGSAGVKTEKAAIDLLLNPKKLAAALERYKNQPDMAQAFVDALKSKAASGGKAGAAAVQAFEAATAH